MSEVVQANCPGCKQVLRIPANWLGQAFKCKHCGMVIQARTKAPAAPAANGVAQAVAPKPVAKSAAAPSRPARSAKSSTGDPFAFDGDDAPESSARPRPRRRSRSGALTGLILAGVVLVIGGVATVLAWPHLAAMMAKPDHQVAANDDSGKKEGDPSKEEPRPRDSRKGKPPPQPRETSKPDLLVKPDRQTRRDPPVKPDPATKREGPAKPDLPVKAGPLPRRALAISINNYLFANPINYGLTGVGAPSVQTALERFTLAGALHIPADQTGLLSDGAAESVAQSPTEPVIRATISNFLTTSRPQDRIILLIVGHVVEIEGEPMLLAIDGAPDSKDGAIPLKWIYDQLAACKARQKVLILDTCRLNPAKGMERPGSGPMGAKLDAMLKEPPSGVQVWASCSVEQFSYEFEGETGGGEFIDALCEAVKDISKGKILAPDDPLPVEQLKNAVNARMNNDLGKLKKSQTSRLAGTEPADAAPAETDKPRPPKPKPIVPEGQGGPRAAPAAVSAILKDISFPPLKVARDQQMLTAEMMPAFPADALKEYMKEGEPTPLRAEVQKARELLADIAAKHQLKDRYTAIAEGPLKAGVRRDQLEVAKVIAKLQEASDALKEVAMHRRQETKRWQANYDYIVARMEAQIAYLNEYQAVLGQILKGLPSPDSNLYSGWQLASQYDPQTGDSAAKKMTAESRKKLDKIIEAYPKTPWAIVARRDRMTGLGLEWQPMKR